MPREKWRRCQANKTRGRVLICLLFAFSLIGTAGWLVGWNSLVRLLVKNTIAKMPVDVHGSAFAVNETEAGLMLVPRLVAVGDTSDNQDAPEDSIGQGCFYLPILNKGVSWKD